MKNSQIYISQSAIKRLKKLKESKENNTFLRIEVIPGGCKGFNTKFSLDNIKQESDITFYADDVCFITDPISLNLINGSTIDFTDSLMGSYFWLNMTSDKKTCSCGTSFSTN